MDIEISLQSIATGARQVVRVPMTPRLALGRGPESPVLLDGPAISRQHLVLAANGAQLSLWNMSANGTMVNGAQVPTGVWRALQEGDLVQVPGYNLSFMLIDKVAETPESFLATITGAEKFVLAIFAAALGVAILFWTL